MITVTVTGVEAAVAGLNQFGDLRSRLRTAVRNTIRTGKSELKSRITARYTAANPMSLGSTAMTVSSLRGVLKVGGKRNQLRKFIINPRARINPAPKGGVYAQVVRGQGGSIRRAFLQRSGNVFERISASRFPIRQLRTVSLPGMAKAVSSQVESKMYQRLGVELDNVFG